MKIILYRSSLIFRISYDVHTMAVWRGNNNRRILGRRRSGVMLTQIVDESTSNSSQSIDITCSLILQPIVNFLKTTPYEWSPRTITGLKQLIGSQLPLSW